MGHENVLNDNSIQQQNIIGYERGQTRGIYVFCSITFCDSYYYSNDILTIITFNVLM